MSFSATYV